jgi:hypothetical protein
LISHADVIIASGPFAAILENDTIGTGEDLDSRRSIGLDLQQWSWN